jgi:hypothetical protein
MVRDMFFLIPSYEEVIFKVTVSFKKNASEVEDAASETQ